MSTIYLLDSGPLGLLAHNRLVRRVAIENDLSTLFTFVPVSSAMWRLAAELWADARSQGIPTAHPDALDSDALIAAQAREMGATVVTSNSVHLGRWVAVKNWP